MRYELNINKIKGQMAEKGKTQKDLAKMIGVSGQTINSKLNGTIDFKVQELCDTAEALEVSPSFFITPKAEKYSANPQ